MSPDHGLISRLLNRRFCKYWPSCSEYTYQAVEEFGIIRGLWMGLWRIMRCNPWSQGGIDPIPKRKK
ncbi:hypothetical protein AMJ57_05540 [Parcubacteria bacterium SG8_24]|nr:MAG: hypothetical protein AMJ57_05540 [Parcubacteria bacterium SG8_24]